jgi:hypothetical protein
MSDLNDMGRYEFQNKDLDDLPLWRYYFRLSVGD